MKTKAKTRVDFIDDFLKPHLLDKKTRTKLGNGIAKIGSYHTDIPIGELADILEEHGIVLVNEDFTAFGAIFCGREGTSRISLAHSYTAYNGNNNIKTYKPIENAMLILNWYKIVTKYDINAYIS